MLVLCRLRQVLKLCPRSLGTIWLDAPEKDSLLSARIQTVNSAVITGPMN